MNMDTYVATSQNLLAVFQFVGAAALAFPLSCKTALIRNDSDARQDISPSMAIGHTMVFGPVPSEVECHDANQRPDHERDFK